MEVALASPLPLSRSLSSNDTNTRRVRRAKFRDKSHVRTFRLAAGGVILLAELSSCPVLTLMPGKKPTGQTASAKMDANCRLTTFRYNRSRPCVSFLLFPPSAPPPLERLGERGGELATLSCCLKCQNRWTALSRGRSFYRRVARWRILLRLINAIRCR